MIMMWFFHGLVSLPWSFLSIQIQQLCTLLLNFEDFEFCACCPISPSCISRYCCAPPPTF